MKNLITTPSKRVEFKEYYLITYQIGLIISLLILILIFKSDLSLAPGTEPDYLVSEEIIFLEETIQTKQEVKAPPPPRPTAPVEVPNDEILEDEILMIDAEFELDEYVALPPPPAPVENEKEEEEEIFVVVEQPPVLIGGLRALQSKVVYPNVAIEAGIEGRVIVEFVISKEGSVSNTRVIRGIGAGCDEEAVRVINTAKFVAGLQRGKPVQVRYTIPILFKLSSN